MNATSSHIGLISTFFVPYKGGYTSLQLYCVCGRELDGMQEYVPMGVLGDQLHTWLECDKCGFWATGHDAECIVEMAVSGII